jgi:hypothetical protein
LDPRFGGANSAEEDGFLMAIKIRSTTSLGGEVNPSAHVVRFYGMLKKPAKYERDMYLSKFTVKFSPKFSLLCYKVSVVVTARELWWMSQEGLDLRWGTHNISENGCSAWDALCDTTP